MSPDLSDLRNGALSRTVASRSLAETGAVATAVGGLLRPGDVVLLVGQLGAGKTAFTKLLAASLGVTEAVTSPTFTIMTEHHYADHLLLHLDAYRLEGPGALEDIGLFELLDDGAIAVIEWGDVVEAALGSTALRIEFELVDDDSRTVCLRAAAHGDWADRWYALVNSLGATC